jgi:hypothetical protein
MNSGFSVADLKFVQQGLWRMLSSEMCHRVVRWKFIDVSEEHSAASYRVEE